jgi:hypothetical protein
MGYKTNYNGDVVGMQWGRWNGMSWGVSKIMTWYYRLCLRHLKHLDTCTTRSAWEHRPHWGRWSCLRENMFGAGASWEKWSALCLLFHTYNLEFWPRMKWYDRDWLKSLGTEIPHAWFILGGFLKWRISSRHHGFQYVSIPKWSFNSLLLKMAIYSGFSH